MKKVATKWDELSYEMQKQYLHDHPASKRKLTAKPTVKEEGWSDSDKNIQLKRKLEDKATIADRKALSEPTKEIIETVKETLPDRLQNSKKVQLSIKELTPEIEDAFKKLKEQGVDVTIEDVKDEVDLEKPRDAVVTELADATIDAAEKATKIKKSDAFKYGLRTFVKKAVPAGIFGFIDNFIMVTAGQFIDQTVAQQLQIGTMAAAGIGNTISDAVGAAGQDQIDSALDKIGLGEDDVKSLGDEKLEKKIKRVASLTGSIFGITAGCLLGMFPLAFMKTSNMRHIAQIQAEYLKIARRKR